MSGRIGFVVPAFNAEATLADTLRSLLDQDDAGWNAIVINDGSTDATASVARSFADPRITILHQQNAGLASARNTGLAHLRTEFVSFLDADDTVMPSFVGRMRGAIGSHDAAVCGTRFVGPGLEDLGWTRSPGAHDLTPHGLIAYNPLPVGSVLLRRSALQRLGALGKDGQLFDPSLPVHEDWDCWLRLSIAGLRVAPPMSDALFAYRLRPGSMSRAIVKMHDEGERVIRRHAPAVGVDPSGVCRDWTLRHIARAVAEGDASLARRWAERLSPLTEADLGVLAATLPHAMRRADPCPERELAAASDRWRSTVHRCLPAIAAELLKRAGFGSDLRLGVAALKAEAHAGRSIVLFGAGERGRALARACHDAGVAVAHWIDDHPAAALEHCGTRKTPDQLTADHTLVITPDAPEAILQRLGRTPARVLLLRDAMQTPHSQSLSGALHYRIEV